MQAIENLNSKRVLDISHDKKTITIRKKDCITIVTANADGTLKITQKRIKTHQTK